MKKIFCAILSLLIFAGMNVSGGAEMKIDVKKIREVSVHDPSIIKDTDGKYYVFGSHITTAESDDLINWSYTARGYKTPENVHFGDLSETLKGSFKWAGEDDADCKGGFAVWAPDVFYNEKYLWEDGGRGAYMMYYSASSTYKRSCIGLAVSRDIKGPYKYVDTLIYSGFTKNKSKDENSTHNNRYTNTNIDELIEKGRVCSYKDDWGIDDYNNITYPNAIDPCVYEDGRGRLYLTYGSWSGGIFTLPINELNGLVVYPGFDGETEDGRMIDRYFGTHIAGGKGWSGEGPFIYYDKETEYFYLQTSYEWLGTDGGYHIRMFRSTSPYGPFTDIKGNSAVYGEDHAEHGVKMFGNYYFDSLNKPYTSGGHCSSLIDDDNKHYLFYHTRFKGTEQFQLRVHQMFTNEDGWPVVAPFRYMGSEISPDGYSDAEIVGVYEYINHSNRIGEGAKVSMSQSIMLTSEGYIRGAVSGRWIANGKYVTMHIDNKIYKGVFFKQLNENGEEVMTFTLVGGDNEAVWGVKADTSAYDIKNPSLKLSFDNSLDGAKIVTREKNKNPEVDDSITAEFKEGIDGAAVRLDGTHGMLIDNISLEGDTTVSFWMKPEKLTTYSPVVAASADFVNNGVDKWFSLTTFTNGNDMVVWSRNAEYEQWLEAKWDKAYKMNHWQHVTIVFDNNYYGGDSECIYAKLYINGYCVATGSVSKDALGKDSKFYFGINPWDNYYTGLIDELCVFDRALSHVDVFSLYNSYGF